MRRALFHAVAFFLVGCPLAAVVAWAMLAASDVAKVQQSGSRPGMPPPFMNDLMGETFEFRGVLVFYGFSEPSSTQLRALATDPDPWNRRERARMFRSGTGDLYAGSLVLCGWPRYCLEGWTWDERTVPAGVSAVPAKPAVESNSWWTRGAPIPWKRLPRDIRGEHRLPVRPRPAALATNGALFGGAAACFWHALLLVRGRLRVRCGLCPRCTYPAGPAPRCPECGRRVRPRTAPPTPPAPLRRPARALAPISVLIFAAVTTGYIANLRWGFEFKGPSGVLVSLWRGQLILGRTAQPFHSQGLNVYRVNASLRMGYAWVSNPDGSRLLLPLWPLYIPALPVLLAGAWRRGVRRGIARHWPQACPAPGSDRHEPAG